MTKRGPIASTDAVPLSIGAGTTAPGGPTYFELVVDAVYPAPAMMRQEIAQAKYRDVYLALQQSGVTDSKLFFLDLGYDGLRGAADAVDVLYEGSAKQTTFDGQPEKHKLTKGEYEKEFATAEAAYSRLLDVLISRLKESATP